MNTVKKKYGLWTGMAMVVGIVIGSGVFLKAGKVLRFSNGNLKISLLAWLIGGLIMVSSGFCFAIFANREKNFNGVVDYVEKASNKRVSYHLAWLISTLYYPTVASIVSVFAGAYVLELFGAAGKIVGDGYATIYQLLSCWQTYLVGFGFLTLFSLLNYFAPRLSGKFQISATVIKLIPILVIAIVGLFASLIVDGRGLVDAFSVNAPSAENISMNFGEAVKTTAFAYEGWVCATIINAELKDSKKNLPKALAGGTAAIVVFYILYYIGISAFLGNGEAIAQDANAPLVIFNTLLGKVGEKVFCVFIIVSCLGTVNGVTLSCARGFYTMAVRGQGPQPEKIAQLDSKSNMSWRSCLAGYIYSVILLVIWYLANTGKPYFQYLGNMDAIVCALIYGCFIVMFIYMMKNYKDLSVFKRYVMPIIAIVGCSFFVLVGTGLFQLISGDKGAALKEFGCWCILLLVICGPSLFFYRKKPTFIVDNNVNEKD